MVEDLDIYSKKFPKKKVNKSQIGEGVLPEEVAVNYDIPIEKPIEIIEEKTFEEKIEEVKEELNKEIIEQPIEVVKIIVPEKTIEEIKTSRLEKDILQEYETFNKKSSQDFLSVALQETNKKKQKLIEEQKKIEEERKIKEEEEIRLNTEQEQKEQLIRDKLKQEEEKNKVPEENLTEEGKKFKKQKYLHGQMRALLNDYPMKLDFAGIDSERNLIESIIFVYDMLNYCSQKTTDQSVFELFQDEIKQLDNSIKIKDLRDSYYRYKSSTFETEKIDLYKECQKIFYNSSQLITEKVIFFSLAIPKKDKRNVHLRTLHGMPGNMAEEYESEAIREGESVEPGQSFRITEEGGVEAA